MKPSAQSFARYLPSDPHGFDWGVRVLDAGFSKVPSFSSYPPPHHPSEYLFSWDHGRTLGEFQLVFILEGSGRFESRSCPLQEVTAGNALLLFPHEWHRYQPLYESGWTEYWIGFNGELVEKFIFSHFDKCLPVLTPENLSQLHTHFENAIRLFQSPNSAFRNQITTLCLHLLTILLKGSQFKDNSLGKEMDAHIANAQQHILDNYNKPINLEKLASDYGLSYTRFRTSFREMTGHSPHHYQLLIRINRAKDILRARRKNVSSIAEELGFSSVYYFSRIFKRFTGLSPTEYQQKP